MTTDKAPERVTAEKLEELWEEFEASAKPTSFDGDTEFFNVEDMQDQAYYLYDAAKSLLASAAPSPDVLALVDAAKDAERFLDYFANNRLFFEGGGTPKESLAGLRAALARITDTGEPTDG